MKAGALLGVFAALATAVLWGSNHVVSRGMRDIIPLPAFVFWRWLAALLFLTLYARRELLQSIPLLKQYRWRLVLVGIVGVGIFSYCLIGSAYHSPAVEVGLLNATTPIWVALMGIALGVENLRPSAWFGLGLALMGTAVVLTRGNLETVTQFGFGFGNLLALSAAVIFAWFSIQIRQLSRQIDFLVLTIVTAWAGTICVLLPAYLVSLSMGGPFIVWPGEKPLVALAALLYVALLPTMMGNVFYLYGVKSIGPANTAMFLYLSPVFSGVFAILFLDEHLEWFHFVGFLIVVSGLLVVGLSNRAKAVQKAGSTDQK